MRKTVLMMVLAVLLTSFVYATLEDELVACGNNVRCKFRVADKYADFDACSSLEGQLGENCEDLAVGEEEAEELRSARPETTGLVVATSAVAGIVVGVVGFLVLVFFLFLVSRKQKVFINTHADLIDYVNDSLKKNFSEEFIINRLRNAGWKESVIKEAIKDANKLKK
ncbi:hypothetical protein HQ533_04645 [Candidatus Woesearchaeota archaeon]|nr:hypothetical protein [Candidatus Woesearchaeota archaeon]